MPRIIQTNPDGSEISNYLTQSAVGRPLQTGQIRTLPDGTVFAYSGLKNFGITAPATVTMLNFQLTYTLHARISFNANWDAIQALNADIGVQVNVDGIDIIETGWEVSNIQYSLTSGPWIQEFIIPANKACSILTLNKAASAGTNVNANVTLIGKQI